jgi:hypothetical protein
MAQEDEILSAVRLAIPPMPESDSFVEDVFSQLAPGLDELQIEETL